jgi:Ca-activated chloride channel family protein
LRLALIILLCFGLLVTGNGQSHYLRGEVKDDNGRALQNVTILNKRTGYTYKSGSSGAFGIIQTQQKDSFLFSLPGFIDVLLYLDADKYASIKLKAATGKISNTNVPKLASFTAGLARRDQKKWFAGEETYASLVENGFINTQTYPNTGIALHVDKASYSNIRRFINTGSNVPPDAVRTEELLNYFNLNNNDSTQTETMAVATQLTDCPWNKNNQLCFINLKAKKLDVAHLPQTQLVFLIDISASMDMANRLPLLQSAFKLLTSNLRAQDSVTIVVYGGVTGVMLQTTSGGEKEKIYKAIDELTPGGYTPGQSGIQLAYNIAKRHFIPGGNNRVVLATDGDFNVGMRTDDDLESLIVQNKQAGIYLTCLGVGMGNYKDSKIQLLARMGNGNFAYLDSYQEAEKVLMTEFTQTLYSVADNAYVNLSFNPEYVQEYRLLGFDNKLGAISDTLSIVDGGEIGSGHSLVAAIEFVPAKAYISLMNSNAGKNIGKIELSYRSNSDTLTQYKATAITSNYQPFDKVDSFYRMASSLIMYAGLLKQSINFKHIKWDDVIKTATESVNTNNYLHKDYLTLLTQTKALYTKQKKKKKKQAED